MFNAAFISCWDELIAREDDAREEKDGGTGDSSSAASVKNLALSLQQAMESESMPTELLQRLLNLAEFLEPTLMTTYPKLAEYKTAVFELPGVKEYVSNPDCIEFKYTFNNKVAKIK